MDYGMFFQLLAYSAPVLLVLLTLLWLVSVRMVNAAVVDVFWGFGFVVAGAVYFAANWYEADGINTRSVVVMGLVAVWGLRLSGYLFYRNYGKEEDKRYQSFRKTFGAERYWWVSFFQVFLLQGILMWIISAPLNGAMFYDTRPDFGFIDGIAAALWCLGLFFESVGDYQLAAFKSNPDNTGKVMQTGLWRYTRHPNYFGDTCIWWGFGLFSVANEVYVPLVSSALMMLLIIKVSGVAMLEKTMNRKPEFQAYVDRTSAFIPWFPKKQDSAATTNAAPAAPQSGNPAAPPTGKHELSSLI
ncbi:hypothetical protein DIPPA_16718 [Diplonema papillatum]|nr:hypothetical protein DIPPA_16718 [Diplonema papillatum]|eukprot:gene8219-12687_t